MKHLWKALAVSALAVGMLAGCAGAYTPATLPAIDEKPVAVDTSAGVTYVNSIKELAAAIVPGAVIELGEGTYTMEPENGDPQTNNSYCLWTNLGDGYELVIRDVSNVTIRGAGMDKTRLESEPRDATVLSLHNCKNVTLEGFTAGHTQGADMCEGNVIDVYESESVTLKSLGLYGCGSIGVNAQDSQKLKIVETDIYDCSSEGLSLCNVRNCVMENSTVRDLNGAYCAVSAWDGDGLEIIDTAFTGNSLSTLISVAQNARFTNCEFRDNQMSNEIFSVYGSGEDKTSDLYLENCTGSGNQAWNWRYQDETSSILDGHGDALEDTDLEAMFGTINTPVSAPTQKQETVTVTTADEFLAALGSNRDIVIDTPVLDLSTASDYTEGASGEDYYWTNPFDGPELTITGLDNLTIRGKDGKGANVITAVPRYAQVLNFENCTNVTVKNLTAGHTQEPGSCIGGVLQFTFCQNVTVSDTGLYGCGTIGIQGSQCRNMVMTNNEIYECSQGGVSLYCVKRAAMEGNTFRDLGSVDSYDGSWANGYIYSISTCEDVTFDGKTLQSEDWLDYQK